MTDHENLDSILRRIEKMLAIANCPGADPNEAAAAAGMAERIMRKYQIEQSDVLIASLKRGEGMEQEDVLATAKTNGTKVERVPLWANQISVPVGKLCEVQGCITRNRNDETCIRFFGFGADVKMASWMFSYLVETVNLLCINFRNNDPRYTMYGRKAVNSYRQGVAHGIIVQLNYLILEKQKEQKTTGQELVIAKEAAIEDFFGIKTKTKAISSKVSRGSSYHDGVVDGKKVDLKVRGVEGKNSLYLEKK